MRGFARFSRRLGWNLGTRIFSSFDELGWWGRAVFNEIVQKRFGETILSGDTAAPLLA